jgi:hypothetical protein
VRGLYLRAVKAVPPCLRVPHNEDLETDRPHSPCRTTATGCGAPRTPPATTPTSPPPASTSSSKSVSSPGSRTGSNQPQGLNLNPFRLAASRPARRASLAAASLALASLPLLALAALAYLVFYHHYVPARGLAAPAHLQFAYLSGEDAAARAGAGGNLRAAVRLPDGVLAAGQAYDVAVELRMPRAARNLEAGNFMLDLQLLAGGGPGRGEAPPVVARERRPASLTYRSPPVEWARRAAALPLYVVGWWREEERLAVPLMEGVTFAAQGRRAVLPTDARIEILTDARLQVYSAQISFRAKLKGLRSVPLRGCDGANSAKGTSCTISGPYHSCSSRACFGLWK